MKKEYLIGYLFIFSYIVISFIEWGTHYYVMHCNGFLKNIFDYLHINTENSHIDHHLETRLDQTLPDGYIEEGLVFNILDSEIIFILSFFCASLYLFWFYFPGFKKSISFWVIFAYSIIVSVGYTWTWGSIHSYYHKRYIEANKPLKNNPNKTVYSPLPFFVPDNTSGLYKYLFWYHTIHHLTKGEYKGNYNIICPLFDFIFGTYKSNVDNSKHFSKNIPQTFRDEWLKNHPVFDIRIVHNTIEYKVLDTDIWRPLPSI
jgi:hypothetical protein